MTTTTRRPEPPTSGDRAGLTPVIALPSRDRHHPAGRGRVGADERTGRRDRAGSRDRGAAGQRPAPDRPDAGRMAGLLVRLAAEVAAGRRPLRQLDPLLAPSLSRRLAAGLRPGVARPQDQPEIVRVLADRPTPSGAVEATVLIRRAGRVTAVAVRLERHLGAWRATELTAPEAGYAPLPTRSSPRAERGLDAFDEAALEAEGPAARITPRRGSA